MIRQGKRARSPYQRYAKAPTAYSPAYQMWRGAMVRRDTAAAEEADRTWRRMFQRNPHRLGPVRIWDDDESAERWAA